MKTETLKKHIQKFADAHNDVEAFEQIIKEMKLMADGMEHVLNAKADNADMTQDAMQMELDGFFLDNSEHDTAE